MNTQEREDFVSDIKGMAEEKYIAEQSKFDPEEQKDRIEYQQWKETEQSDEWLDDKIF